MTAIIKTYIQFFFTGHCLLKYSIQEVEERELPYDILIPINAYGYRFFDVIVIPYSYNGLNLTCKSERFDFSANYYFSDRIYTIDEFRKFFPKEEQMIKIASLVGCGRIARCSPGNFVPIGIDDEIVEPI